MINNGIDIIEIERIERAIDSWGRTFLERICTSGELSYIYSLSRKNWARSSAVRFAAKEAVFKVLSGKENKPHLFFTDIEVKRHPSGKPGLVLTGKALIASESQGFNSWSLSLSHSQNYAVASVLAVGGE